MAKRLGCFLAALLALASLAIRLLSGRTVGSSGGTGGKKGRTGAAYTKHNSVGYLIDGVDYFGRLARDFASVAVTSDSYAHMRFWLCDHTAPLDPNGAETFYDAVAKMSAQLREVRILLWQPTGLAETVCDTVKSANEQTRDKLNALPNVSVRTIERTTSSLGKDSYHEKTTMIKKDAVTVTVGGLNVAQAYLDERPHDTRSHWHDVAATLVGPATDDVEDDFRKDWAKGKPAGGPGLMPPIVGQPTPDSDEVYVGSSTRDPKGIRRELLFQVDDAKACIYLENYSVHHPKLVKHLARRIDATRGTAQVDVVIVVPPPGNKGEDAIYGWLHYVTYVELSLARCSSFRYKDGPNTKIARRGAPDWTFERRGDWYEDSRVRLGTGFFAQKIAISDLIDFTDDVPLYKAMYSDAGGKLHPVYVHSKVAIFDTTCAVVGSANFNPRSLDAGRDGETSLFVKGPSVPTFRAQLWGHWHRGNPPASGADWRTAASANAQAAAANTLAPNQCYVLPVEDGDWVKTKPDVTSAAIKTAFGDGVFGDLVSGIASVTGIDSADLY